MARLPQVRSRMRQRTPMTASKQPSVLNTQLAKALIARESVQIMAEEISSLFLCRVRLPKNLSKPVIGRQGIAHMPRGSLGMVQPEIAHVNRRVKVCPDG